MLKIALLLLFFQVGNDSWVRYIYDYLDEQIHTEKSVETIWSTGVLYYSGNEYQRDLIVSYLQGEQVRTALRENESLKEYLLSLSKELKSEHLFLGYLLQEENKAKRQEEYQLARRLNFIDSLAILLQKAVAGESIDSVEVDTGNLGFEHFLISYHVSSNNITSEEYFQFISEIELQKTGNNGAYPKSVIFRNATIFKALFETNQYSLIDKNFQHISSLDYLPYSRLKLNILWAIDYALYSLGRIDKALKVQRTYTLPIASYLELSNTTNSILASQGGYLYQIGKYHEAKELFSSLLNSAENLPDSYQASLYNNLSLVLFKTGESNSYIETQLKALDVAKRIDNYEYQTRIYRNLHLVYSQNQNWDLAEKYINEALNLASHHNNVDSKITILTAKASFEYFRKNNLENALNNLESAGILADEASNYRLINTVDFEKARLHHSLNNYSETKRLLEQIKSRSIGDSDTNTFLEVTIKIAQIETYLNNYTKARNLMREVRAHDMSDLDFSVLILAQAVQADIEAHFGNTQKADGLFAEASDLVFERSRNTSETESGYWTVQEEYLYLFEKYADFLLNHNRKGDALVLFDRIKTINDASLTDNPLVRSSQLSEEALTRIRNLTREMDSVRRRILTASDDERLSLQNRLERLSAERRSLSSKVDNTLSGDVNIGSVQRQLRPSETLLHITEVGRNLYYAEVKRNDISIKKLEMNGETLELFEGALDSILKGRTDLQKFYQIGKMIGIDKISANSRSIIVMPDSYFHQLPVDILPIHTPASSVSYGSAEYLIEHAEVRTLNSLRDLTTRYRGNNHSIGFSGFGVEDFNNERTSRNLVSLPKAPQEILLVKEQLNRLSNNRSFINATATADEFQKNAGRSKILHMATHSEVSESDPLFSTLHFYSDGNEEQDQRLSGRLFAYQLFELNLQNDLIMLNSCESGGDRFLQGSGVMGISRALRYAGAKSLVLNSWSVNDHYAAEFAEEFYRHINDGKSKSKALQLTKVHFIKNKNANPHFWGPYILNGDHRPLVRNNNWFAGSLLLAAIFLSGLVFTGRNRKRSAA